MKRYEDIVLEEVQDWKRKVMKRSSIINRLSKQVQGKINDLIPEKAHQIITEGIKGMVKTTLFGSEITTKKGEYDDLTLKQRDQLVKEKLITYRKAAVVEGAGTGAGGILLGLADFPLLLSIKMKFLFDVAAIYGFDTKAYDERLFLLHVFQLAYSSDTLRQETLEKIENWEEMKHTLTDMDWQVFQQEYRDHIDLAKMLQLLPGIGAAVGAYANYNLLDQLGETAMNAYRLRILKELGRI